MKRLTRFAMTVLFITSVLVLCCENSHGSRPRQSRPEAL